MIKTLRVWNCLVFKMESFRELPVKTIPIILLLDLRRRHIRVPQEIQMLIMFYKEIAETRNKMAGVVIEFSVLPKCSRFLLPQHLGIGNKWKRVVVRTNPHQLQEACHHCSRYYEHLLSVDIMAEASNRKINLDRLFNACAARAIMMYRENTIEPKGKTLDNNDLNQIGHLMNFTQRIISVMERMRL